MSGEFWGVLAIGLAVVGFNWRMLNGLRQEVGSRLDRIETRLDALTGDVASVKERLAAVETTLNLLIRGLHIEVSGREGQTP